MLRKAWSDHQSRAMEEDFRTFAEKSYFMSPPQVVKNIGLGFALGLKLGLGFVLGLRL